LELNGEKVKTMTFIDRLNRLEELAHPTQLLKQVVI